MCYYMFHMYSMMWSIMHLRTMMPDYGDNNCYCFNFYYILTIIEERHYYYQSPFWILLLVAIVITTITSFNTTTGNTFCLFIYFAQPITVKLFVITGTTCSILQLHYIILTSIIIKARTQSKSLELTKITLMVFALRFIYFSWHY